MLVVLVVVDADVEVVVVVWITSAMKLVVVVVEGSNWGSMGKGYTGSGFLGVVVLSVLVGVDNHGSVGLHRSN